MPFIFSTGSSTYKEWLKNEYERIDKVANSKNLQKLFSNYIDMQLQLLEKDKRIIITLSKGPSRAMKIRLNKHTDDYGRIYGTTDSGSAFQLSIQSSFSLNGKYTIYPTNFYGIVVGEKISPKTNVTHEEVK